MKIRRWLPSASLALCVALAPSPLRAADAEWQTSWDAFVDAFNTCIRDAACDRTHFVDKSVTQRATIKGIEEKDGDVTVTMDMSSSAPLVDKAGVKAHITALTLHPTPEQNGAWAQAIKGQRVRFRCRTTRAYTDMDSPVGFISLGPGSNMVLISTEGGELIEILAN